MTSTPVTSALVATTLFWSRKWTDTTMPLEVAIAASVVSGILGTVGAISNAAVMYIIIQIRKHQDRKNVDILIVSLCLSDFLSSVLTQPLLMAQALMPRPSITLQQLLTLQIFSHCTLLSGSLGLFTVTLERYVAIRFPFIYANNDNQVTMYISLGFIWITTILLAVWVVINPEGESKGFPIAVSLVFTFTMILQIMIFTIVQAQNRNLRRQIQSVQHNESSSDISQLARRANAQRFKENRTILYICAVFISAWLPSILFRLYYAVSGNGSILLRWVTVFRIVVQIHSCINPFIYSLRTERVKRAILRRFGRAI